MSNILLSFLLGISCAVISVTIITVMPLEPILNWWFVFGERVGKYLKDNEERERWFYKPIWGCDKCFAGQLALWSYLIWHTEAQTGLQSIISHGAVCWVGLKDYSLFCQVLGICVAIYTAVMLSFIYKRVKKSTDE